MQAVPLTPAARFLISHFWRMDRRRFRLGVEFSPLRYDDFLLYSHLTGFPLSAWEVEMLEMLDDINCDWYRNRQAVLMENFGK